MYHNTLDLNHIVAIFASSICLNFNQEDFVSNPNLGEVLIACMYITQTSKEVEDVYNKENKGELWNIYIHAKRYNV